MADSVLRLLGAGRDTLMLASKVMFSRDKLASEAVEVLSTSQNNEPLCSSGSSRPAGAILFFPPAINGQFLVVRMGTRSMFGKAQHHVVGGHQVALLQL